MRKKQRGRRKTFGRFERRKKDKNLVVAFLRAGMEGIGEGSVIVGYTPLAQDSRVSGTYEFFCQGLLVEVLAENSHDHVKIDGEDRPEAQCYVYILLQACKAKSVPAPFATQRHKITAVKQLHSQRKARGTPYPGLAARLREAAEAL